MLHADVFLIAAAVQRAPAAPPAPAEKGAARGEEREVPPRIQRYKAGRGRFLLEQQSQQSSGCLSAIEECLCLGVSCVSCLPVNQESFILDLGELLFPSLVKGSPPFPLSPSFLSPPSQDISQWAGFM